MFRPTPPLHASLRALLAGLLVCVLALQAIAVSPARAAGDNALAAARCADANPDAPAPVDPPPGHCKLCGAAQAFFFFIITLAAAVAAPTLPARIAHVTPRPPDGPAASGWGSSWSSQAPPA